MKILKSGKLVAAVALVILAQTVNLAQAQRIFPTVLPEQRTIQVRDPSQLARYRIPDSPNPSTVANPQPELEQTKLSLDDAIRIALDNSEIVRVLTGVSATSSGQSIYDVAATNTTIDQQNARFDPTLSLTNTFNRLENPQAIFDPNDPTKALITGVRNDGFNSVLNLEKTNALGGTLGFGVNESPSRTSPNFLPLNPFTQSSANLNYTQPLLQGARIGPNLAPIVIARINTERSYFQYKDSVQEMVRGVIDAYWSLVSARTDVWARRQQVEQLTEALRRIKARFVTQNDNGADLAQAQLALANLRATLIAAEANIIQREAALRNILGLPPSDGRLLVPVSPPNDNRFHPEWEQIKELAAERRPDVIELKLILEADEQQLIIAKNNALPRLDTQALYRWNGLEGTMPNGNEIRSPSGAYTDWTMGVNFSVPIGLRQSRASLRQQELIIARDRANLQQGLHNSGHQLATSVRSLEQLYEQYLAYREARRAARINLDAQLARYRNQLTILLNVLQAISDWGNTVSAEAAALTQYNTMLATLERQTGTILETHGVIFYEERYGSIGPLGRFFPDQCYPQDMRPTPNNDFYETTDEPAEEKFDLKSPPNLRDRLKGVPYDDIELPKQEELQPDNTPLTPEKPARENPALEKPVPKTPNSKPSAPTNDLDLEAPEQLPAESDPLKLPATRTGSFMDQAVAQAAYRRARQSKVEGRGQPATNSVPVPITPVRSTSIVERKRLPLSIGRSKSQ